MNHERASGLVSLSLARVSGDLRCNRWARGPYEGRTSEQLNESMLPNIRQLLADAQAYIKKQWYRPKK